MRVETKFCALLLLAGVVGLTQPAAAQAGGDFEWRVQLRPDIVAPSNIEATNICFKTHRFQVDPETLPFMRLLGPSNFPVNPGNSHKVPVEFDTRKMKPGQYEALIVVKCLTCKSERGCKEDHQNLRVFLTVLPAAPNWSSVRPEQKIPEGRGPAVRWPGIAPEQKPRKE